MTADPLRSALEAAQAELLDIHRDKSINADKALAIIDDALATKPQLVTDSQRDTLLGVARDLATHCGLPAMADHIERALAAKPAEMAVERKRYVSDEESKGEYAKQSLPAHPTESAGKSPEAAGEDQANAERYRHLREFKGEHVVCRVNRDSDEGGYIILVGEAADAAIDAETQRSGDDYTINPITGAARPKAHPTSNATLSDETPFPMNVYLRDENELAAFVQEQLNKWIGKAGVGAVQPQISPVAQRSEASKQGGAALPDATTAPEERQVSNLRQSSDPTPDAARVLASSPGAESTGCGVLVGGALVAWFADPEEAEEWGRDHYFGQWLTWRTKPPEIIPLTPEEYAECQRVAAEMSDWFAEKTKDES